MSSCIFTFLYRLWVLLLICSVLVLSWALMHALLLSLGPSCLLLLLCGLSVWLGRLLSLLIARVVYQCWYVSSYFIGWWGNIWLYSRTWCLRLNPSVKLHALHGSVVPTGVTVQLEHNPPRSWTGRVGPSLPGFTIAPCVDSLLCYRIDQAA